MSAVLDKNIGIDCCNVIESMSATKFNNNQKKLPEGRSKYALKGSNLYIGLAIGIGRYLLSIIGYWNIGKIPYQCITTLICGTSFLVCSYINCIAIGCLSFSTIPGFPTLLKAYSTCPIDVTTPVIQ